MAVNQSDANENNEKVQSPPDIFEKGLPRRMGWSSDPSERFDRDDYQRYLDYKRRIQSADRSNDHAFEG